MAVQLLKTICRTQVIWYSYNIDNYYYTLGLENLDGLIWVIDKFLTYLYD